MLRMTASEYAAALGNNCRVLKYDAATAAIVLRHSPAVTEELHDTFWNGYRYGRATAVQALPLATTVATTVRP